MLKKKCSRRRGNSSHGWLNTWEKSNYYMFVIYQFYVSYCIVLYCIVLYDESLWMKLFLVLLCRDLFLVEQMFPFLFYMTETFKLWGKKNLDYTFHISAWEWWIWSIRLLVESNCMYSLYIYIYKSFKGFVKNCIWVASINSLV